MIFYFFTFNNIAQIPPEHDPEDYYFIGALVALSCAIFGGALIVICSKVTLIRLLNIYKLNRIILICTEMKSTPYFQYISLIFFHYDFRLEAMYQHNFSFYQLPFLHFSYQVLFSFQTKEIDFSPPNLLKLQSTSGDYILVYLAQVGNTVHYA